MYGFKSRHYICSELSEYLSPSRARGKYLIRSHNSFLISISHRFISTIAQLLGLSISIFLSLQHLPARIQLPNDTCTLYRCLIFSLENSVRGIPIRFRSMFDILWSQRDVSHLSWFRITPPLFHWFGFSPTLIKSFIIPLWGWKPRWHTVLPWVLQRTLSPYCDEVKFFFSVSTFSIYLTDDYLSVTLVLCNKRKEIIYSRPRSLKLSFFFYHFTPRRANSVFCGILIYFQSSMFSQWFDCLDHQYHRFSECMQAH